MSLLRKKVAQPTSSSSAIAANDQKSSIDTDFSAYGVIGGLLSIIKKHKDFMESQEKVVDNFVAKSQNPDVLRGAKKAALATEGELMDELMNDLGKLSVFLNDIILIENLFNSLFAAEQRQQQQQARKQHAPTISKHESKPKPTSQCNSFTELMLAGSVVYLPSFKKFISAVENECQAKQIRMVKSSGAQTKNIQRAFYKTFYVYAIQHGLQAHQQMTDVLRCSLVFDDFTELYRCFSVIETMAQNDPDISGGILRCKDRYNPESVPFGYRDLLVNLHCPGSAETIVCEIQLHHMLFYQHKKISHRMYKRARLFEDVDTDENMAYNHADKHTRKTIGDKVYEIQDDDKDAEQDAPQYAKLLKAWGLEKFIDKFEEDGWTDILSWSNGDLSDDDLKDMGLKKGHIKTFKRNVNEKLNVAVAVAVADAQPGAPEPQQVSPKTQLQQPPAPGAAAQPPQPVVEPPSAEPGAVPPKPPASAAAAAASQIDIRYVKEGDGPIPGASSAVEIEFSGFLKSGKQFIMHREVIQLGKNQNIEGLEQAVTRIKVGSIIKLSIPSRLAYGARGAGNLIPPNSDLIFNLKLHRIVQQ